MLFQANHLQQLNRNKNRMSLFYEEKMTVLDDLKNSLSNSIQMIIHEIDYDFIYYFSWNKYRVC
jgi:hypothetical protein